MKRHHWPIYFSTKGFRGAISTDPPNIPAPFFRDETEAQGVNSRIPDYKRSNWWNQTKVPDYANITEDNLLELPQRPEQSAATGCGQECGWDPKDPECRGRDERMRPMDLSPFLTSALSGQLRA